LRAKPGAVPKGLGPNTNGWGEWGRVNEAYQQDDSSGEEEMTNKEPMKNKWRRGSGGE